MDVYGATYTTVPVASYSQDTVYNDTSQCSRNNGTDVDWFDIPDLADARFICEVGLSFPLAVLGIIGNVLAFIVLCNTKNKLTTTVLLQALAVADTLVLISSILLRSMRYVNWTAYNTNYYMIFLTLYPSVYFFRLADTWITVLLTIDRYIVVCYPLHAQSLCTMRRTYITMTILILSAFVFSVPRFFEYKYIAPNGFKSSSLVFTKGYVIGYTIVLFFLAMYLIPMGLLVVLNSCLVRTLKRANVNRQMSLQQLGNATQNVVELGKKISRSVTMIVVTVVLACILCNICAMTVHILHSLQRAFHLMHIDMARRYLANVSNVLVTLNCTINFVIYCMCSRNFRKGFMRTFSCTDNGPRYKMGTGRNSKRMASLSLFSNSSLYSVRYSVRKQISVSVRLSDTQV